MERMIDKRRVVACLCVAAVIAVALSGFAPLAVAQDRETEFDDGVGDAATKEEIYTMMVLDPATELWSPPSGWKKRQLEDWSVFPASGEPLGALVARESEIAVFSLSRRPLSEVRTKLAQDNTSPQPSQTTTTANEGSWVHKRLYEFLGGGMIPEGPYKPLNDEERWQLYIHDNFLSAENYALPWIKVIPDQISKYPKEWTGFGGYTKRVGVTLVGDMTDRSISHSLHRVMNTEPRYVPCQCGPGFWKRTGYALKYYYARNTDGGKTIPNLPNLLGTYTEQFVTQAFYPGRYDKWLAVRRATSNLIVGWWLNVVREFRPEIADLVK